ncbi:MAG: hypothetical protein CMO81_01840 [Waddliaceae bacterium]|nr:hypothetical protein [Waddliaceae bacterium]
MSINFDDVKSFIVDTFKTVGSSISRAVNYLSDRVNSIANSIFSSSKNKKKLDGELEKRILNGSVIICMDPSENRKINEELVTEEKKQTSVTGTQTVVIDDDKTEKEKELDLPLIICIDPNKEYKLNEELVTEEVKQTPVTEPTNETKIFKTEVEQTLFVSDLEGEAPVAVETSHMSKLGKVALWTAGVSLQFFAIYHTLPEEGKNHFRNMFSFGDNSQGTNGTLV